MTSTRNHSKLQPPKTIAEANDLALEACQLQLAILKDPKLGKRGFQRLAAINYALLEVGLEVDWEASYAVPIHYDERSALQVMYDDRREWERDHTDRTPSDYADWGVKDDKGE